MSDWSYRLLRIQPPTDDQDARYARMELRATVLLLVCGLWLVVALIALALSTYDLFA